MSCTKCGSCISKGRDGEKGSWCEGCGHKVYEVEERECQNCKHYFFRPFDYSGCSAKLMRVSPEMHVTFSTELGTCFEPK